MSIKGLIGTALVCSAFFVACHKEPQGMMLVAEGFGGSGSKAAVQDNHSYWIDGETVRINGTDYRVNVDAGRAYVSNVDEADIYRAIYPDTLASTAPLDNNNVTVTIPSKFDYRKEGGRQVLAVPMAAYGTSDSRLKFYHLTAAITVQVTNNFGIDLLVDSIVVSSQKYQLSGNRSITLGTTINVEACTTATSQDRRVVVYGRNNLRVNSGQTVDVQLPVLPVGADNRFTITVATHNADDAVMTYTFSRTQPEDAVDRSLARACLGYAPAKFGGVFSVSLDKQVRFSPGNLQYYCSTSTPQWRFAQHQYDVLDSKGSDYGQNTGKWIGLFGFATSGATINPYETSTTASVYSPSGIDNISKTIYDWGWNNSIINGGNAQHIWRTLTSDEIAYLIENNDYGKAKVGGKYGLIILPDNFVLPEGCSYINHNNEKENNIYYTATTWPKMEVAGAIFLPDYGYRSGTTISGKENNMFAVGRYWTSSKTSTTKGMSLSVLSSTTAGWITEDEVLLNYGYSVRVVRDVN